MDRLEETLNKKTIPTDRLMLPLLAANDIEVDVLRLDLIDPVISGNKWFKLKNYLAIAKEKNLRTVLTFGGAFSNHIVATACATFRAGLLSIGIIRGEESRNLSHTLLTAAGFGMKFEYLSRAEYRTIKSESLIPELARKYPDSFIVPEGGAGPPGIEGAADILKLAEKKPYDEIICAIGTGTMFAGLAIGSESQQFIRGISVLKGIQEKGIPFQKEIENKKKINYCAVHYDYHFGGYAKKNDALFYFMNHLYEESGIPTDFVYTAKLFYAVVDLVRKKQFSPGSRLLIIHSGGLQGNRSLKPGTLIF
ncbi:MAG: 1-aminocyclopropane-1-carboxylate deaminase [Bacteroidetes bacterium]|nr:MAG: 1-aminocyclopropane-1-carboxylate deaminase [Bacteroidota bacterium]